mmetsp:Transcript_12564/g.19770  ORF Transcript_12564/g.19770 Transcript_12564/m.19770 type:complete len:104 (-) Transcript_12564:245-556(-)
MSDNRISGIPVVDEAGKMVDLFTDGDIFALSTLDLQTSVASALQQARGEDSEACPFCSKTDSLSKVVSTFSTTRSTRLACCNADGVLEGVITLTDLFKFLMAA